MTLYGNWAKPLNSDMSDSLNYKGGNFTHIHYWGALKVRIWDHWSANQDSFLLS